MGMGEAPLISETDDGRIRACLWSGMSALKLQGSIPAVPWLKPPLTEHVKDAVN